MRARQRPTQTDSRLEEPMKNVRTAMCLAATLVFAACASGSSSVAPAAPSPADSPASIPSPVATASAVATPAASTVANAKPATSIPSAAPSAAIGPTTFTSLTYGYSLTVPAGWSALQASKTWSGTGAPSFSDPVGDQFDGPGVASAAGIAAPTIEDLKGYIKARIAANTADHGDTCPAVPESKDPIKVGGESGMLLAWNCGILINIAVAVHDGIGYSFGMRDPAVHAATDPTDRAAFLKLLKSVDFPG
jgi:hypothetical protein